MELAKAERDHFNSAFFAALAQGHEPSAPRASLSAVDAKKLFCENWSTVEMVLSALPDLTGNKAIKAILPMLVAAISAGHDKICK